MKYDEEPLTLGDFLQKTKEKHEAVAPPRIGKDQARKDLGKIIDQLVDLADNGDGDVQHFLLEFAKVGAYLIKTAQKPGEPCPDCGKIH